MNLPMIFRHAVLEGQGGDLTTLNLCGLEFEIADDGSVTFSGQAYGGWAGAVSVGPYPPFLTAQQLRERLLLPADMVDP